MHQRQRKPVTMATWQQALDRAIREGVEVQQLAGSGAWIATSGTDRTKAYGVTLHACECPGGEHGYVCKHRARLAFEVGALAFDHDDTEPEPPAVAAPLRVPVPPPACAACRDNGYVTRQSAAFPGRTFRVACASCGGHPARRAAA